VEINTRHLWFLLSLILALRLLIMWILPVLDTSEARYAEISRLMLQSGDWLMPQFREGVPFWGKPPLFAWLTAGSFSLFGFSEFSARLPHFLLGIITLWLVFLMSANQTSETRKVLGLVILASTPLFFTSSGTVMTESGLLFATTLSMSGYWLCINTGNRWWGLAFFAGLGFGMLAKGPVAVAMILLPLAAWWVTDRRRSGLPLMSLPWLTGIPLALIITVPWYVAAEQHSPGFLEYFLLGEHLLRFIQPGWSGDMYGNAHREALGMVWLWWYQAAGAWGLVLTFIVARYGFRAYSSGSWHFPRTSHWQRYLLCWMLAPLVFFTFSHNILWTYVITGMPAFALLLASQQEELQ
jgi:4-amino-4-deoxy-L-arabinose transferase-like glycosyltransferase